MKNMKLMDKYLGELMEFFKDKKVPAVRKAQTAAEGVEIDIVNTLFEGLGNALEDLYAEFFFSPIAEGAEVEVLYFNHVFTVTDHIEEEHLDALISVIPVVNFFIPSGSFCINPTGETLVYKNCNAIPVGLSQKDFMDVMIAGISLSLDTCAPFIDMLYKGAIGEMTPAEIEGVLY